MGDGRDWRRLRRCPGSRVSRSARERRGRKGVFDSSDGTVNGKPLNSSPTQFFRVSEIAFDPHTGDMYVADGHAKGKGGNNFRIVVYDRSGHYLRQWKVHRSTEEAATAARATPHCVR